MLLKCSGVEAAKSNGKVARPSSGNLNPQHLCVNFYGFFLIGNQIEKDAKQVDSLVAWLMWTTSVKRLRKIWISLNELHRSGAYLLRNIGIEYRNCWFCLPPCIMWRLLLHILFSLSLSLSICVAPFRLNRQTFASHVYPLWLRIWSKTSKHWNGREKYTFENRKRWNHEW